MILCISVLSVVVSPFSFLILLIWFFSLFFLMSLANGLSILFIFSKNQLLVLLIFAISQSLSQSLSHIWLFATPWTAVRQASLSITNSWSLLKLMSIESVMSSNHLIFCCPLLLPPSIFPIIRVFFSELVVLIIRWPKYWSSSFSNIYSWDDNKSTCLVVLVVKNHHPHPHLPMQEIQEMWVWFPGSGISPGVGNGNQLQYSCLGNSIDRGAWQVTVPGAAKSWTRLLYGAPETGWGQSSVSWP